MNQAARFAIDVVMNILVLAVCPLLVLAWIVRVNVLDWRHRLDTRAAARTGRAPSRTEVTPS
jgi:hypothetical protein